MFCFPKRNVFPTQSLYSPGPVRSPCGLPGCRCSVNSWMAWPARGSFCFSLKNTELFCCFCCFCCFSLKMVVPGNLSYTCFFYLITRGAEVRVQVMESVLLSKKPRHEKTRSFGVPGSKTIFVVGARAGNKQHLSRRKTCKNRSTLTFWQKNETGGFWGEAILPPKIRGLFFRAFQQGFLQLVGVAVRMKETSKKGNSHAD